MTARRYPLATLIADMGVTPDVARRTLGVSGSSWARMLDVGVTEVQADRLAARAGLTDLYVWPELLEHRTAEFERTCAADGCTARFVAFPSSRRKWCSTTCRARQRSKDRRRRPLVEGVIACAAGCGRTFEVFSGKGDHRRFCGVRCRRRMTMRRFRSTPAGAQANRDAVRRYRADVRESRARRALATAALVVVLAAGCGSHAQPAPKVETVTLPNGRAVTCVVVASGISCDFLGWSSTHA